jgi:cytochrome c553
LVIFSAVTAGLMLSVARGEEGIVVACQACHGTNGVNASPEIPNLASQKKLYLAAQLQAFKSGERKHELMNAIAGQLSDTDIEALAGYWSGASVNAAGTSSSAEASQSPMTFPPDFPRGFVLYRSDTDAQSKSVSRFYANELAAGAAQAGKPLPAGAVIVVANYSQDMKAVSYSAMESRAGWGDAVPGLLRNGDWRYALFDGHELRRDGFNYAKCLACHKPAAKQSFVFTLEALAKSQATGH